VIPEPAKKPKIVEPQPLDGAEQLIGIAGTGTPTLEAMELGEEEMQGQQMVDQVNSMVKDNPDAAAQLVKRWLNRS